MHLVILCHHIIIVLVMEVITANFFPHQLTSKMLSQHWWKLKANIDINLMPVLWVLWILKLLSWLKLPRVSSETKPPEKSFATVDQFSQYYSTATKSIKWKIEWHIAVCCQLLPPFLYPTNPYNPQCAMITHEEDTAAPPLPCPPQPMWMLPSNKAMDTSESQLCCYHCHFGYR